MSVSILEGKLFAKCEYFAVDEIGIFAILVTDGKPVRKREELLLHDVAHRNYMLPQLAAIVAGETNGLALMTITHQLALVRTRELEAKAHRRIVSRNCAVACPGSRRIR